MRPLVASRLLSMLERAGAAFLAFGLLLRGCSGSPSLQMPHLKYHAIDGRPVMLALYEPWFGRSDHINVGYDSHDPKIIKKQIDEAKKFGISAFVIDWYGNREPFNNRTYALVQAIAAKKKFHVAMMYDETADEDGATDEALSEFRMFRDTYLALGAQGHDAYLTYQGRPVIFIFPKGGHTDWKRVRQETDTWSPAPLLIQENAPGSDAAAFDGFYAWVQPGGQGWTPDGSNWGQKYLDDFYRIMRTEYPDKITVGGVWAGFNDSKATWGLHRYMDPRCGQTFLDTLNEWRKSLSADEPPPFLMIETWNDYEEGTAIERGIPTCKLPPPQHSTTG